MAKVVERDERRMYELSVDDRGDYHLRVVAGGIGMYEVVMQLNEDEVRRYRTEGKVYMDDLAYQLAREHRAKFQDRT